MNYNISNIIHAYTVQKLSMDKIAEQNNCSHRTIKRILIKNNIKTRDNNCYKCKQVNERYFEHIDTENKAYILGFLFADGCVTKGNTMSCKLCIKDIEILKFIKNELHSNHKIGIYSPTSGYKTNNKYCMISIVNKKMHDDLVQHGMTERKTKTLCFPYNEMDKSLYRHFIRGFF